MFKKLSVFQLKSPWPLTAAELEAQLGLHVLNAPTGLSSQSSGWLPIGPDQQLVYSQDRSLLLNFGIEKRVIPKSAVERAVADKAAELERERGFKPGRKMMRALKDEVLVAMLPKALTAQKATPVRIDTASGRIYIADTGSAAEEAIEYLRRSVGFNPLISRLDTARSPVSAMTAWLAEDECPLDFGDFAELSSTDGERASVRFKNHPIAGSKAVRDHISIGKVVVAMGLVHEDRLSFVLDDRFQFKSIRLLDIEAPEEGYEDHVEQFDAELRIELAAIDAAMNRVTKALAA